MLQTSLILLLGIALLVLVVNLPLPVVAKFVLGIAAMYGISKLLGRQLNIKDDYGMLMVRSKAGLKAIESLARSEEAWKLFADLGTVVAYGLLAFFILKREPKQKFAIMVVGLALLTAISFFVAPAVFPFLLQAIGGEGLGTKAAVTAGASYAYFATAILYAGGMALTVFASLMAYTGVIISALASTLFQGTDQISKTAPGATLILPGVNIPFAEGVIALALILLVHEGSHAVLSRIGKIKILSSGVVLFGVLPIGAFVEPDEEQLRKLDTERQTRVLVAGSAANLFTSLLVFLVFLAFLYATVPFKEAGLLVIGGNHSGDVVHTINGVDALTFLQGASNQTKYNSTLVFGSDKGTYSGTITKGTLYDLSSMFFLARYSNPALQFLYNLLGLVFSLNFVIGVVNLLPLPLFDGYRIMEINVDKKVVVTAVSALTALAFLVNFLPWLF